MQICTVSNVLKYEKCEQMNQLNSLELYGVTNNTMTESIDLSFQTKSITTVIQIHHTCKCDFKKYLN